MIVQFIDLIFRVLKIMLLSSAYTSIVLLVASFIAKRTKSQWLSNRMNHKIRNGLLLHFLISIALFYYSFTYWQDTGLGDNPSLPIGYGQRIYCPDFAFTMFFPDLNKTEWNQDELGINKFMVQDSMLCAEVSHNFSNSPKYDFIVCNLQNRTNIIFQTRADYEAYAELKQLPKPTEFQNFRDHYHAYFDKYPKWKRWLLP